MCLWPTRPVRLEYFPATHTKVLLFTPETRYFFSVTGSVYRRHVRTLSQDLVEHIERNSLAPSDPNAGTSGVHRLKQLQQRSVPPGHAGHPAAAPRRAWLISALAPAAGAGLLLSAPAAPSTLAIGLLTLAPVIGARLVGLRGAAAVGAFGLMAIVALPLYSAAVPHLGAILGELLTCALGVALGLMLGQRRDRAARR